MKIGPLDGRKENIHFVMENLAAKSIMKIESKVPNRDFGNKNQFCRKF